jgi:hypothetical protein
LANCLAHGRRQFVELTGNFPDECGYILRVLAQVYKNDAIAKKREMSDRERLRFHQDNSGPLMEKLRVWLENQLAGKKVEPNSGMGEAIGYMLKHWEALTLFLRSAGAPLEKLIVLQDGQWGAHRGHLYEPHPHLRSQRRGSLRLSYAASAPRQGGSGPSAAVASVDLPPDHRPRATTLKAWYHPSNQPLPAPTAWRYSLPRLRALAGRTRRIELIRVVNGRLERLRLHQESVREKVARVSNLKHLGDLYHQYG